MQKKAVKFKRLDWQTSEPKFVQANHDGEAPQYAVRNKRRAYVKEDGKYLVREPNKLILVVEDENGQEYSKEILYIVHVISKGVRMSKNRRAEMAEFFENYPFEVEVRPDSYEIFGAEDAVYLFLNARKQ